MTQRAGSSTASPVVGSATAGRAIGRTSRWILFLGLAAAVVVVDQLAKAAVTSALSPGESVDIIGDAVRIVFGQNSGALFGLFQDNAVMFGVVSLVVIGLIVAYHARAGVSLYLTVTLGLLLGGAIGNMIDRLRLGYVVDFVDVGIGTTRFYTFNVADSAISLAILMLFLAALRPSLIEGSTGGTRAAPAATDRRAHDPSDSATDGDPWDDDVEPGEPPPDRAPGDASGAQQR